MKTKPPAGLVQKPDSLFLRLKRRTVKTAERLKSDPHFYQFLISIFGIFVFLFVLPMGRIQRVENIIHDAFFRQRNLAVDPSIVVIEIAEDSLQSLGRWPWTRSYHAAMTHILNEWGARAIIFDVLFSEPGPPQEDQAFAQALAETRSSYFSTVLEPHENRQVWVNPVKDFTSAAKGVGHINIKPDADGTLRRIQPYLKEKNEGHPHLAVLAAYDYLGKQIDFEKERPFPLDRDGNLLINWPGPWKKTFKHYSYADLLVSYQAAKSGRVPEIRPDEIKGKICLIGVTATGLADIKANPLEGAYPAIGVHASIINSILTERFLKPVPARIQAGILVVIGMAALIFLIPFRNVISLGAIIAMSLGWILTSFLLFSRGGILIFTLQPVILMTMLFIFSAVFALIIANKERFHFFQLATRDGLTGLYVIRHFKAMLAEALDQAFKTSESLSLILIDIDNFKKINDTCGHQAGDMILRGTAHNVESCVRIKRSIKEMDYVARYGGEEIVIFLRKSDLMDAAFKVAERIRKTVEGMPYQWEGQKISPTISLGVSALRPGDTVDSLIRRADEALYRAKKEGKNRVCIESSAPLQNAGRESHD